MVYVHFYTYFLFLPVFHNTCKFDQFGKSYISLEFENYSFASFWRCFLHAIMLLGVVLVVHFLIFPWYYF